MEKTKRSMRPLSTLFIVIIHACLGYYLYTEFYKIPLVPTPEHTIIRDTMPIITKTAPAKSVRKPRKSKIPKP